MFFFNYFISFYTGEDWNIFFENKCNVPMYSKTQIYSKNSLNDF
jgi:hypothetical protein